MKGDFRFPDFNGSQWQRIQGEEERNGSLWNHLNEGGRSGGTLPILTQKLLPIR